MHRALLEYRPEIDEFHGNERTAAGESAVSERNELTLSTELLERAQSGEAESFVVDLIDRAARGAGRTTPPAAQPLAHLLSQAARLIWRPDGLPHAGRAAHAFGVELEGLSHEDQAFEVARQFVRFVGDASRRMLLAPEGAAPRVVADRALRQAAGALAPGLLRQLPALASPFRPRAAGYAAARPSARASQRPGFLDITEESVMHDIDRTQLEFSSELPGFESGSFNNESFEFDNEEGVLSEADEAELADELLGVSNEEELDQFLGSLIRKVAKGAGKVLSSPVGQAVGGVLKGVAKKALPLAGGALGGWVGGPLGAKIGSGLASAAGSALGLEGESFDGEGEQYEGAKQFVRLAADTVTKAAAASPSADPRTVAQRAAMGAARQLAPGLLGGQPGGAGPGRAKGGGGPRAGGAAQSGRWARRGSKVVLYGV